MLGTYSATKTNASSIKPIPYHHIDNYRKRTLHRAYAISTKQLIRPPKHFIFHDEFVLSVHPSYSNPDRELSRWEKKLEEKDNKSLWRDINWNDAFGEVESKERSS